VVEKVSSAVPCIACATVLEPVFPADVATSNNIPNQVYGGLIFSSYGNYGSFLYDPMDGSRLEIILCDDCISTAARRKEVVLAKESNDQINYTFFAAPTGE
jgi:hypothetical protein